MSSAECAGASSNRLLASLSPFTSGQWSWWHQQLQWFGAEPNLYQWSCLCRRSRCRWSPPCPPHWGRSASPLHPYRSHLHWGQETRFTFGKSCQVSCAPPDVKDNGHWIEIKYSKLCFLINFPRTIHTLNQYTEGITQNVNWHWALSKNTELFFKKKI